MGYFGAAFLLQFILPCILLFFNHQDRHMNTSLHLLALWSKNRSVITRSSRSVIGSKGGQGSKWQQAAGAKVAARRRAAEASGRKSVRRAGKFHARFAKSSAQVLGRKRAS